MTETQNAETIKKQNKKKNEREPTRRNHQKKYPLEMEKR